MNTVTNVYIIIIIIIIIIIYPRYQGSRGIWKKNNSKMIGVAITPDSRREWRRRGATRRYCIVAPGWTDVEIKKPSHACHQIREWSFLPDVRSHKPTHWSGRAFQQRLAQSESRLSVQYICLCSWKLLVLLLILFLGQLRLHIIIIIIIIIIKSRVFLKRPTEQLVKKRNGLSVPKQKWFQLLSKLMPSLLRHPGRYGTDYAIN